MKLSNILAVLLFSTISLNTFAITPEEKGLEIMTELKERDSGWNDMHSDTTMILKIGEKENKRNMEIKTLEVFDGGDKSLIKFLTPKSIKGTGFLTYSHVFEPDEQWIYLPALKRTKRISSQNKSGPFLGSEFSYEDMSVFEVEKFDYKYLKDETIEGIETFVVEQYPKDEYSGYSKRVTWIDKERYVVLKTEFYDVKNALLKTLTVSDLNLYEGKFWRAGKSVMKNNNNNKSTILLMNKISFNNGYSENDFNKRNLSR